MEFPDIIPICSTVAKLSFLQNPGIAADDFLQPEPDSVADNGMTDGDLCNRGGCLTECGEIFEIQVVSGIDTKPQTVREVCGRGKFAQYGLLR